MNPKRRGNSQKNKLKFWKIEIILGRISLIFIFLLVGFFMLEVGVRIFMNSVIPHGYYQVTDNNHVARPYVMAALKPGSGRNRLGYYGDLPVIPKPKGNYYIFLLGGSALLNGEPPFPKLLEKEFLYRGFGQVKIFNWGVSSSNTTQDLIRILLDVFLSRSFFCYISFLALDIY